MYKKNLLFVFLTIISLVTSYIVTSLWVTDNLPSFEPNSSISLEGENNELYTYSVKDFKVNSVNSITSLSNDPHIGVHFKEPIKVEEIELVCNVGDSDSRTTCQIFYTTELGQGFSEANSVSQIIGNGTFVFDFPDEKYSDFRFDFTNENGTGLKITEVSLYENRNDLSFMPLCIGLFLIISVIIYTAIYGKSSKIGFIKSLYQHVANLSDMRKAKALLFIAILFTCIFVYGKILISGNVYVYTDIGSDTINTYVPSIKNAVESIKKLDFSFITLEYGLGSAYYSKFTYFFDPFYILTILLCVIFGSETIPFFLILVKVILTFVIGYIGFKYFLLFTDKVYLVALISYLYSFNSFSVIWGQHYQLSIYSLYALTSIYFIELYLRKNQDGFYWPLIIISLLVMINTVYLVYMIYLVAAIYAIIRYIMLNDKFVIKRFFIKFFNLALNIILGFMGGLAGSFGYFLTIFSSGRVNVSNSGLDSLKSYLKHWHFSEDFFDILKCFISPNAHGNAVSYKNSLGNYYESPKLYLTIISIILIIQFILNIHKNGKLKTKICCYFSCILLFFAIFNVGGGYIMYALSQKSSRYTFSLLPIIAIAMLLSLENVIYKKQFNKIGFIISLALTFYLLFDSSEKASGLAAKNIYLSIIMCIVAGYLVLELYLSYSALKNRNISIVLMLVLFFNTTFESYLSVNYRGNISADHWKRINNNSVNELINYLNDYDDELYRIDANVSNNIKLFNASLLYGFNSVSVYDSVLKENEKSFYNNYTNPVYSYRQGRSFLYCNSENDLIQYSMLGLKYVILSTPPLDIENYTKIADFEGASLYRINATDSFTTFYENAVLENEFLELDYSDKTKILSKAVVLNDEYQKEISVQIKKPADILEDFEKNSLNNIVEYDISESISTSENTLALPLSEHWSDNINGDVFFEADISIVESGNVKMYFDLGSGAISEYVNNIKLDNKGNATIRYLLPRNTKKIVFKLPGSEAVFSNISIYSVNDGIRPRGSASSIIDDNNESVISGTITCENDGYMLLPIWHDENWKAYVDGVETEIIVANTSLMAIKLTKGEHQFTFKYVPVELYIGLACLASSLIMGFVYWLITKKVRSKSTNV